MNKAKFFIKHWLEKKAALINHKAVIKDLYLEVDISPGYFLTLTIANLIALNGLITNNTAVIIGAMLISPLMGPVLSFGFAFITEDTAMGRKAVKKLTVSIILTLLIAGIATYLSPLKDVTDEIIARTRPNLYDLIIAFLAGTAGAIAICTKKSYITIVPGVAIATAVIPPLSVTGFGIGIGSIYIAWGGFFLFFTNFVAIIISTCIIFYIYGFRPAMIEREDASNIKKRAVILIGILLIISIPLFYTLKTSIAEVRLRSNIQFVLKQEFDIKSRSHLSTFSYLKGMDESLEIHAVVNTVDYLKEAETGRIEKNIRDYLHRDVKLNIEQVKVHAGGLKEEIIKPQILPAIAPPKPTEEIIKTSMTGAVNVVKKAADRIEKIISPSTLEDFYVGFSGKTSTVLITLNVRRDEPLSEEAILWLRRMFTGELNLPVELKVETIPFVPPLIFDKNETMLSNDMKNALKIIKEIYGREAALYIMVESSPALSEGKKGRRFAEERVKEIAVLLNEDYKLPAENIRTVIHKKRESGAAAVKVSILGTLPATEP
ncbi:MAG: TIGR00341 family protein [Nitrospinae bacterium]|nr:TIGR00341 family protein [Nitrospinota bacterium]